VLDQDRPLIPDGLFEDDFFAELERADTALHEAGHAVAASLLGLRFRGVTIRSRGGIGGQVFGFTKPNLPRWVLKHDVVSMAGPCSEKRWGSGDTGMAEGRVGWVQDIAYFQGDEARMQRAWALAMDLIVPHKDQIMALRRRLLDEETIYAREVHQLVPRLDLNGWPGH
jgi:hypothetical protein